MNSSIHLNNCLLFYQRHSSKMWFISGLKLKRVNPLCPYAPIFLPLEETTQVWKMGKSAFFTEFLTLVFLAAFLTVIIIIKVNMSILMLINIFFTAQECLVDGRSSHHRHKRGSSESEELQGNKRARSIGRTISAVNYN
jgi:hypothetical protein